MPGDVPIHPRGSPVLAAAAGALRALVAPVSLAALAAATWLAAAGHPVAGGTVWLRDAAVGFAAACSLGVLGLPAAVRRERRRRSGIEGVDTMSGAAFEERLADLFGSMGYDVARTGRSGDFGADLLVERAGTRTVVQAKRYERSVGIEAVQQAIGATRHYGAERAMVVTSADCTPAARALAASNEVVLVERAELVALLAAFPIPGARRPRSAWWALVRQVADGAVLLGYAAGLVLRGAWWVVRALVRGRR